MNNPSEMRGLLLLYCKVLLDLWKIKFILHEEVNLHITNIIYFIYMRL
jgi:hypothetical protein